MNSTLFTGSENSFINYEYVLEYSIVSKTILGPMLLLLLLTFLLYLLSTTADSFFCPTLQSIVEYFKISPNLAGVTFLSFGNGSPDVFSNIAAFASQSPNLGIAGIVGGGLFVSCGAVAFLIDLFFNLCASGYGQCGDGIAWLRSD